MPLPQCACSPISCDKCAGQCKATYSLIDCMSTCQDATCRFRIMPMPASWNACGMLCLSRFSCQGRAIAKTCSDICSELFVRLKHLCISSCSRVMYLWRDPAGMKTLERACCLLTCWVLNDTLVSSCGQEMSANGTWQ